MPTSWLCPPLFWTDARPPTYGIRAIAARLLHFIGRYWGGSFTASLAIALGLSTVAPILAWMGHDAAATSVRDPFRFVCHQDPRASWWVFGYPMAICQRDVAIYGSMLVTLLLLQWRRILPAAPSAIGYALLSLPILVDGGTATLGLRESTPLLRTLTGMLFGGATVWFVYPLMSLSLIPTVRTCDPPGSRPDGEGER